VHCKAIHLRAIERWKIRIGYDVFGEDSSYRLADWDGFNRQSGSLCEHDIDRFGNGNHRGNCSFVSPRLAKTASSRRIQKRKAVALQMKSNRFD
jgi:hypothetical protein